MNKTVVLTGSALQGIGEAILRLLLSEGYHVIGTYEPDQKQRVAELSKELPDVLFHEVEHASRPSLAKFVQGIKNTKLDGLVNAQMFFHMEDPDNFDHNIWEKSLAINLTAPNFLFHELKSQFIKGGAIVTITSTEGFIGSFGASAYAATKAAIHNLIKTHANTVGSKGIRVNAIATGWIGGVMDTDEVFNMSRRITPLSRLGNPEEIAAVTSFLLSEKSSFINGTVIVADGGYSGVDTISKHEFENSRKH